MKTNVYNRYSGIEILRLLSVLGISILHVYGRWYDEATGNLLVLGIVCNSIFNAGVTCFELISGYFGIKRTWEKLSHFYWMTTFYGILSVIIGYISGNQLTLTSVFKAAFPIFTRLFWFATCYFSLMVLSPWINKIVDILSRKQLKSLLVCLICLFFLIPTFFGDGIMNDSGKGLANMITAYLVGRYIGKYQISLKKSTAICAFIIIASVNILINLALSIFRGRGGVTAPFARDCSVLIFALAVFLLLLFKEIKFQSKTINIIASHSLAMYLCGGSSRGILNFFFDLNQYIHSSFFVLIMLIYCGLSIMICLLIDIVRKHTIGHLDNLIFKIETKIILIIKKFTFRCIKDNK